MTSIKKNEKRTMPINDLPIEKDERNGQNDKHDLRREVKETNTSAKTIALGYS